MPGAQVQAPLTRPPSCALPTPMSRPQTGTCSGLGYSRLNQQGSSAPERRDGRTMSHRAMAGYGKRMRPLTWSPKPLSMWLVTRAEPHAPQVLVSTLMSWCSSLAISATASRLTFANASPSDTLLRADRASRPVHSVFGPRVAQRPLHALVRGRCSMLIWHSCVTSMPMASSLLWRSTTHAQRGGRERAHHAIYRKTTDLTIARRR